MQIFRKKSKGFTLIELLVVIAIIGILASIVLVSLAGARTRAKDARIIASMSQLRTSAALYNDMRGGTYAGFNCSQTTVAIGALCTDIDNQNGTSGGFGDANFNPSTDVYCVWANMATAGRFYCIDASIAAESSTDPGCSGSKYTCW